MNQVDFNSEIFVELRKCWQRLLRKEKDVAFERAVLSKDTRDACGTDHRFLMFMKSIVGFTDHQAREELLRAQAAAIVPDAKTWENLGGHNQILQVRPFDKRERVAILEAAKSSGRSISVVIKDRHPELAKKNENEKSDIATPIQKKQMKDVEKLARVIVDNAASLPELSPDVVEIVRLYFPSFSQRPRKKAA